MAKRLVNSFVRRVSRDPSLGVFQVSVNHDLRFIITLIEAEPFEFEPRRRVYDVQHEILRRWPADETAYDFRLFNLRDVGSDVARQELLSPAEAIVLYHRS